MTIKEKITIAVPTILIMGGGLIIAYKYLSENQFLLIVLGIFVIGGLIEVIEIARRKKQ